MSRLIARLAAGQLVGRPALVSPDYAAQSVGINSEVTSVSMFEDLRQLATADPAQEKEAFKERCVTLAAVYNFDVSGNDKPFLFADGFALIPIHGLLINRFNWSYGFATGYNFIRNQLAAAAADDDVTAIIFDVNSCGGMVAGCQETADLIFGANASQGGKSIIAVVDAACHSAAYFLASQADHIAITPTGNTANIGVLRVHFDVSEMLADAGVKVSFIIAGSHKVDGNQFEPLSDEVRADFQAEIDAIYDTFVTAVARGRGLDEQAVRDTEARCYGSADALALGLVDAIQNPSDAVENFLASCDDDADDTDDTGDTPDDDQPPPQEKKMTTPATAATRTRPATPAAPAAPAAPEVTSVDTDAVASEARTAERARISGIQTHAEAADRPKLAAHLALGTDMSVEAAGAILAASAKETVAAAPAAPASGATPPAAPTEDNHFVKAMGNTPNPNVGAGGGNGSEEVGAMTPGQRLLAAQRKSGSVKVPVVTH